MSRLSTSPFPATQDPRRLRRYNLGSLGSDQTSKRLVIAITGVRKEPASDLTPSTAVNQSKVLCLVAIATVACVGGWIRTGIALQDWLWLDELHTAWVAGGSFSDVIPRAGQGNQAPLFFWMVWVAIQSLGKSELSVRIFPLLTGVAVIVIASLLAWKWTRSVIATFVVGSLIAIDPWFVFYGTESRPYGLLQLLGVVQVILFWRVLDTFYLSSSNDAEQKDRPHIKSFPLSSGIWMVVVSAALFYCHYTCVWLFVSEIVFFVCYCGILKLNAGGSFQTRRALIAFVLIAATIAAICIPGVFHLLEIYDRRGNWASVSSPQALLTELRWPVLLHLLLPIICAAIFFFPSKEKIDFELFDLQPTERNFVKLSFVLVWGLLPIVAVLFLDFFQIAPLALRRFTLVGAVALPLFAGLCVASSSKWYGQLAIAVIVVGVSLYQNPFGHQLLTTQTLPRLRFENWSDPIKEINAREDKSNQPVFLFANLIEDVDAFSNAEPAFQEYLRFPINGVASVNVRNRTTLAGPTMLNQHFRPTDIELIKLQGGAWLLIRGDQALVTNICNDLRLLNQQIAVAANPDTENSKSKDPNPDPLGLGERNQDEPNIQFAQFSDSNVYLVSIDW